MNLLVPNLDQDTDRWAKAQHRFSHHQLERFPAIHNPVKKIGVVSTYRQIRQKAHLEKFDHRTIVVQDDIAFPVGIPPAPAVPIVVYGYQRPSDGHICPHAFSATPEGWDLLETVLWPPSFGGLCHRWQTLVETRGVVLNVTFHLEPVRRADDYPMAQSDRTTPRRLNQ